MVDVLFLNPPRTRRKDDHIINMTLLWLASSLHAGGREAVIRLPSGKTLEADVVAAVEATRPRYVAIACKWWNTLYGVLEVAGAVRKHFPEITILVGGHTASTFPRELIATGLIDIVLIGDVDRSLHRVVERGEVENGFTPAGYWPAQTDAGPEASLDTVELLPPHLLTDRPDIVPGYIWLGRGCCFTCFYCVENRNSGKTILGRGLPRVRDVEAIARDARALAGRSQLIFDYELPSSTRTERFLADMCRAMPESFSSCYYFHWGLPTPAIIDLLSERFEQVGICLDVQIFSEPHRRRLSQQRLIKPFVSDAAITGILEHIERKPNVHVDATGIVGMPYETAEDREHGLAFIEGMMANFDCVRDWRFSPLHVIPGTPLGSAETFCDLQVVRRSFDDFCAFTREAYESEVDYYATGRSIHPYGVFPKGQPSAIPDFMRESAVRLEAKRNAKRGLHITRRNGTASIELRDPYAPLPALFEILQDERMSNPEVVELELSLGARTWFHRSWIDYTSESGENSATKCNLTGDARLLEAAFTDRLGAFERISLRPAGGRWGVLANVAAALEPSRGAARGTPESVMAR